MHTIRLFVAIYCPIADDFISSVRSSIKEGRKHSHNFYLIKNMAACLVWSDDVRCVNPDGINPDPENCAQFLACTNRSVVATMQCPESTLFSTKNNTCDLGFLVADECKSRMIPKNVVISTASPTIDKPCTGTSNGDVADMNHCGRFYKCNYGRVVARIKCPSGSAFSQKKRRCDWRASVQCGERPMMWGRREICDCVN